MNDYNLEDYPRMFADVGATHVGVADSLNALFIDRLLKMFPHAKIVVIRREIAEVVKSIEEAFNLKCFKTLEKMDRELDRIESKYDPLVIQYHAFDAERIWKYLLPTAAFDLRRLRMLENFNVTVPTEINFKKAMQTIKRAGEFLLPLIT